MENQHKFVTLHIGMERTVAKVTALLLVVWYSMSIIGFAIHTCSGTGESFVVTFVDGLGCVDIHPEHHCAEGTCCSHSHECNEAKEHDCIGAKACCSNDYQVLALTGTVSDEKGIGDALSSFIYSNCININIFEPALAAFGHMSRCVKSDPCPGSLYDMQSAFGVWRI